MDCDLLELSLHYLNQAVILLINYQRNVSDVIQEFPLKSKILLELAYCFFKYKKYKQAEIMANRAIHYCFKFEDQNTESAGFELLGEIIII